MRIGFMLSFFDFRNDIRRVIVEMSKLCEVVVFIRKEQVETVKKHLPENIEYRLIAERNNDILNSFLEKIFLLFRKIPKTKMNYYLMEEFKIGNIEDAKKQNKAYALLKLHRILPHIFSYDQYLKIIRSSEKTEISDIDTFLCLTEIYDDHLFSRLIKERKKVFVYVYSWDHACKHTRFSKKVNYLVWNEGIKADLANIQQIDSTLIQVVGATQLGYLEEFKNSPLQVNNKTPYYYFGCGIGISSLVEKEIDVIQKLSEILSHTKNGSKLIVRPYPNNKNWTKYKRLLQNENIVLDDSYKQNDLSISEADIQYKFHTISDAKGFFHLGTTLGLEACFLNCPSFIINTVPDDGKHVNIFNFVNQYQNKKYLINASELNTINSESQLEHIFENIQDPNYMKLNYKIRSGFPVKSFEQISKDIFNIMK